MLTLTSTNWLTPPQDLGSDPGDHPEQNAQQADVEDSGHAAAAPASLSSIFLAVDSRWIAVVPTPLVAPYIASRVDRARHGHDSVAVAN
jgi:hypothetical protein